MSVMVSFGSCFHIWLQFFSPPLRFVVEKTSATRLASLVVAIVATLVLGVVSTALVATCVIVFVDCTQGEASPNAWYTSLELAWVTGVAWASSPILISFERFLCVVSHCLFLIYIRVHVLRLNNVWSWDVEVLSPTLMIYLSLCGLKLCVALCAILMCPIGDIY